MRFALLLAAIVGVAFGCGASPGPLAMDGPTAEWPEWGGDKGGMHWSPLTQIDRGNVEQLEVAWVHESGDFHAGSADHMPTALQVTPIVTNDSLYYCTPFMRVFALDPHRPLDRRQHRRVGGRPQRRGEN